MTFQSTVRSELATGVIGDFAVVDGGERVFPYMLDSASAANNVIARAFTVKSEGVAQAGGSGVFAGILVNPKSYAYNGLFNNSSDQLALPNGANGELAKRGYVFVRLPAAAAIGDYVVYNTTTGVLSTVTDPQTPGAGNALVPNARVAMYTITVAGIAVIELSN